MSKLICPVCGSGDVESYGELKKIFQGSVDSRATRCNSCGLNVLTKYWHCLSRQRQALQRIREMARMDGEEALQRIREMARMDGEAFAWYERVATKALEDEG